MIRKINCYCDFSFEHEIPEVVDLDQNEGLIDGLISGEMFAFKCPNCNTVLKPELPLSVIYGKGKTLQMYPEGERFSFLDGKIDAGKANRVVIGRSEFIEKMKIIKNGLDDRVIEAMKYQILLKLGPKPKTEINPDLESEGEISLEYDGYRVCLNSISEQNFVFHVMGLKEDEVGIIKLPMTLYDDIQKKMDKLLGTSPYSEFLLEPYVSISKIALVE